MAVANLSYCKVNKLKLQQKLRQFLTLLNCICPKDVKQKL